ncbi:hypothetical protein CVU75_00370 [Candidatus Dependentiae bacterium HGW-Dependentiae-1]|nr:MAG: hypothetical protein CVU75_00370 [Candidatus Dependentiae bacterium HGW-Dependentiae-1]
MKYTKISTLFFASLLACTQAAHGVQLMEGVVAFLCAYTPIMTVGTLIKLRKIKTAPPGAINTQSEEFKQAVAKIVADELKKKRDESQSGTAHPTPKPNMGSTKPQLASGTITHKSGDIDDTDGSPKRSVQIDTKDHPTNCKCCQRRVGAQP